MLQSVRVVLFPWGKKAEGYKLNLRLCCGVIWDLLKRKIVSEKRRH